MGQVFVVTSGKGGVGKSTITAGLGAALARTGANVLAVDTDIGLRSLDLILGVASRAVYDWLDVINERCEVAQAMTRVDPLENFYAMPAPLLSDEVIATDKFRRMCLRLRDTFDFILVDSPAGIGRGFDLACSPASAAILVVTPDPISIRTVEMTSRLLKEKHILEQRIIINRFRSKPVKKAQQPNIDEVIDGAGVKLIGVVPEDANLNFCAIKGRLIEQKQKSGQAFARIAQRMLGKEVSLKNIHRM